MAELRPELALDLECYRNYFLAMFKSRDTGKIEWFELHDDCPELNAPRIRALIRKFRLITFNGRNYDIPMLMLALAGATNDELKEASDRIITRGLKPWEFEERYNVSIPPVLDHVDIFEVAPGVATSLKIYGGRLHAPKMQDLPIEPSALITPAQRPSLRKYCGNDLDTTLLLRESLSKQLDLRATMSRDTGLDLMSKSDAQIAEAVIRSSVEKAMGEKIYRPKIARGTTFKYEVPHFIEFTTPPLQAILKMVAGATFRLNEKDSVEMPAVLESARIRIGTSVYRMGIGGLHSSESSIAYQSDDDYQLIDRDVASYYPEIIRGLRLEPQHMRGNFLPVYSGIVDARLKAKAEKNTVVADSLKITINGSFGKFGSVWSTLFSPHLLIQTTVTGQLALLMLIESLEENGIPVVSANTDGVVIRCPRNMIDRLNYLVGCWEMNTGFDTEETRYAALYSRDVNNYIAIKQDKDGRPAGAKTKGAYAATGLMKNPQNTICVDAVVAYLIDGTPLRKTIRQCRDIRKFITVRQVQGGAIQGYSEFNNKAKVAEKRELLLANGWTQVDKKLWASPDADEFDPPIELEDAYRQATAITGETYLGKAVRWYYAAGETRDIRYKKANTKGGNNKVPRTEGARPIMDLPAEFPTDVDYEWYEADARSILADIGADALFDDESDYL